MRSLCVHELGSCQTHERPVRPRPLPLQTLSIQRAAAQPYGLIVNYDNLRTEPIEQIADAYRYMETNT